MAEIITLPQNEDIKEVIDTKPKTLDKLIIKANDIALNSHDFMVRKANTHNVRFNESAGLTFIAEDQEIRDFQISRYALGQLGSKIGVPARYLEKCVNSGRIELAQDNVNSWLNDYDKDLFIREYRGGIRGVLSTKYSVCDTPEILEVLDNSLDLDEYNIKGSFLTPERFHLRIAQKQRMKVEGEDIFAGLTIDSSDVGRSTLNVSFLVYKQVCTNGLILSKGRTQLFSQKHIGITAEEFRSGFESSLDIIPEIVAGVEKQIERTRLGDTYNFFAHTNDELEELVKQIRLGTQLSETNANKVIEIMKSKKYDLNRWGYINALTEVAQELTLERRIALEKYAGSLLIA